MIERFKFLAKSSIVYGIGGVLGTLIGVFLTPVLTRVLSPADYGTIDLVSAVTNIVLIFMIVGLDAAMMVHYYETKDPGHQKTILTSAFFFMVGLSIVFCVIAIPFSDAISQRLFGSTAQAGILKLNFLTLPFMLFVLASLVVLRLRFRAWHYTAINILKLLLSIGLTIYLVISVRSGLTGYFQAMLIGNVAAAILAAIFVRRWLSWRPSVTHLSSMLKYGLPLIPAGIADYTLNLLDRFFILHYRNLSEVGLYAVGIKVGSIILLLVNAFQLAWGPYAYSIASQPDAKPFYAKMLTYYFLLTGSLGLMVAVFAREILLIFTAPAFIEAYRVVLPIAFGLILYGAYYIVTVGISITHKTKHAAWTTIVAAALNVGLNFLLIPHFGMIGAAMATMLSYLVFTCLVLLMSQKVYPIPYRLGPIALFIPVIYFLALGLQGLHLNGVAVTILLKALLLGVFFVGLWFSPLLETVDRQGVRDLLHRLRRGKQNAPPAATA
jgi:O-antigen/teichoic acid export membrane protein